MNEFEWFKDSVLLSQLNKICQKNWAESIWTPRTILIFKHSLYWFYNYFNSITYKLVFQLKYLVFNFCFVLFFKINLNQSAYIDVLKGGQFNVWNLNYRLFCYCQLHWHLHWLKVANIENLQSKLKIGLKNMRNLFLLAALQLWFGQVGRFLWKPLRTKFKNKIKELWYEIDVAIDEISDWTIKNLLKIWIHRFRYCKSIEMKSH